MVTGLSVAATAALVRLGRPELRPQAVARALADWRRNGTSHGGGGQSVDVVGYGVSYGGYLLGARELLEKAVHALPSGPARELRRLVAPLDERFLAATVHDPTRADAGWWARRVYR